ncbi:MAG: hypothetical protein HY043_24380 [Verrucomicrobia bacterium]|nr:hypothetical protein [Verrucomicrobiota bacterium]
MSRRRYEILLPTRYNDGAPVEPAKFYQTQEELVAAFGALTTSPELLRGVWMHEGQRFEDEHLRLVVDVEMTAETRDFFRRFKDTLKTRFRQFDIWLVSYEIEVV